MPPLPLFFFPLFFSAKKLVACLRSAATQRPPRDRLLGPAFSSNTHQAKQLVEGVKAPRLERQGHHVVPNCEDAFFFFFFARGIGREPATEETRRRTKRKLGAFWRVGDRASLSPCVVFDAFAVFTLQEEQKDPKEKGRRRRPAQLAIEELKQASSGRLEKKV